MIESVEVMYFIIIIHYLGTSTKDDEERMSVSLKLLDVAGGCWGVHRSERACI